MVTVLDIAEVDDQLASRRLALKQVREAYQGSLDTLKRTLDMDIETRLSLEPVMIEIEQYENEREKAELVAEEKTLTVYRFFTRKGEPEDETPKTRREVVFEPAVVDAGVVLERALANRLDLVNARLELGRRRLEVEASRRTILPDLDLSFNLSQSGTGATSRSSFPLDESSWSVSLSLSMPFSPLDDRVDLDKALLDYEKQRMTVRDKEEEVRKDVRDLIRDLDTSAYAVYSYGLQVRSAHIGLESARITYEMGHTGFFRVLDAEDRLLGAEKNFISAYLDYNLLLQELALVTGRSTGLLPSLVKYGREVEANLRESARALPTPPEEVVDLIHSRMQSLDDVFLLTPSERAKPARDIPITAPLPGEVPEVTAEPAPVASPESSPQPVVTAEE
jgi:outer membrane protein TolC